MARDGLAETRQALSALRGDLTPLEDFLAQLVETAGGTAEVTITGNADRCRPRRHRPCAGWPRRR